MEIPDNLLEYVRETAAKIGHGRVIIELNESSKKIDVISETRKRFNKDDEEVRTEPQHLRQG